VLRIRSKRFGLALIALTLPVSTAFAASPRLIDVPKGTVGKVAFALGRQAGINIAIRDPAILGRTAPALRGRMTGEAALARLAAASGLRVKTVGSGSYVLVAAERRAAPTRPSPPPPAQSSPPEPEAEPEQLIVVTASKRDTTAPRFAGQWTRIDGGELKGWGVVGTEAIEARSVGFSSTHLGSGRNKLFIRGIADSSFSGPTQSPVGQYVGDMRLGYSGPDPDIRLVDIQSVEVLEGPQGTLYGSGSLGGIVLLRPVAPHRGETSGQVSIGLSLTRHGDPGYDASGIFNTPLWDGAALRAVGYHSVDGGYVDNLATGEHDINRLTTDGGRATLSVDIAPGWSVDVSGIGQRIHGEDSQYADRDAPLLSRRSEVDQPFTSRFAMGSLAVRKDDGPVRVRSTTGFTRQRVDENFDASIGDRVRQLGQQSRARSVSNETRVWRPMSNGYSWLAGFSSIVHHYDVSREVREDGAEFDLAGVDNRVRETTVYGEVGVKLLEGLEASVGARYTISDLSGIGHHLNPLAAAARGGDSAERKERRLLPSFSLLARPIDRLTLYGRYQQGFRPGGLSIESDFVRAYRNDRLATAEAGFRYGTPERDPFDLQGSVTRSKWYDIQADFIDVGGLPSTDNIGDGRVWTVTLNGGAQLSDALRIEAGIAWNDGEITRPSENFVLLMAAARTDGEMRIPNIARVAARGAIDWSRDIGGGQELKASGYVRYVGKSRLGVGPRLGDSQGDYVDSGLSVRIGDERRAWSLTVTNLADQVGNRFAFGAPLSGGRDQITPLRPQTVRLGFEAAF
jgi:outer membrane receptor protein involved in Fe transport